MPFKDPVIRKAKHKEYSEKWYAKNKQRVADKNKVRKKNQRARWAAYKATKSCIKCNAKHPAIIDFHHVIRENKQAIPSLINARRYTAAIREAEDKCVPLCANCHRILHWDEAHSGLER